MKITDIIITEVSGQFPLPADGPEERNIHPIDAHPELAEKVFAKPLAAVGQEKISCRQFLLEVRTDDEITGLFGPVDAPLVSILRGEIRGFVLGLDPLEIEKIRDALLRWNRHSHTGYFMMAMSALDCALWDLKGKVAGVPVYHLLSEHRRETVPAYASMLGFSVEPEAVEKRAREYQALGYTAQKWFFRWGPVHGEEGIAKNVEMVRALRQALGEDAPFMLDAFHSWDVPYAVEVGRRIAPFRPAWLEEPVSSDDIRGLREIREKTGIPIAVGEHTYNHWQVEALLEAGAADIIQTDPDWCGGITGLLKIAEICAARNAPLFPHGHSLHPALHVAAALPESVLPQVEFLIHHQHTKQRFLKGYLEPHSGQIRLPDTSGLGIELDPAKVQTRSEVQ
ncbi:MAG: mandelate racemase [Armatimonadetes bacterium]|nr:mandelate racemase [Armatimonadota bacterium]NIO76560.1 mandelate racemase [Armatimonadota bacterium]NIO98922.1 mandelate racemase [Armatimonadota bacterium]